MDELLQTAPCGYVEFADDGKILAANLTLLDFLGYEAGELEDRRLESVLTVAGRIFYQTHLFPLLKLHSKVNEVYISLRSKEGREVPVLINAVRRERDGQIVNVGVMIAIQQRSDYEDAILRAKKLAEDATRAKDEFLAHVSHDLRSPLNAILGWTRMLRAGQVAEPMKESALEVIERQPAASQQRLIEDILDSSRIISGKLRLDVGRVEPVDVINAAIDVVRPAADAKQIRLQAILDPKAGPVSGDPDRLQQIMWNLLTNAIKFTPKKGSVQIRLERVNSHIEISVSDNGKGIKKEFIPFVFERFRQASDLETGQGGLGLGMAITRQLVELHGGTIRAESAGEGEGAKFTLELPRLMAHGSDAGNAATDSVSENFGEGHLVQAPKLDGLQVLVVDDDHDGGHLITSLLTRAGARVTNVSTATAALKNLALQKQDVLVSDVDMPEQDGYALIGEVRGSEIPEINSIPAIALTARAKFSDRMRALSAGYDLHVAKPVSAAELITLIANLSRRRNGS